MLDPYEQFTSRDAERVIGFGMIFAAAWYYNASRSDDEDDADGLRNVTPK
ncbi:MAG: hypothetical protein JO119_01810 [Acidobacteria bacterium]|nr:hypothetical protein [Acidobacteriota bacterium]